MALVTVLAALDWVLQDVIILGLLVVGLEASWHGEAVAALLLLRHGHSQGGDDGDPDGLVNLGTNLQRSGRFGKTTLSAGKIFVFRF